MNTISISLSDVVISYPHKDEEIFELNFSPALESFPYSSKEEEKEEAAALPSESLCKKFYLINPLGEVLKELSPLSPLPTSSIICKLDLTHSSLKERELVERFFSSPTFAAKNGVPMYIVEKCEDFLSKDKKIVIKLIDDQNTADACVRNTRDAYARNMSNFLAQRTAPEKTIIEPLDENELNVFFVEEQEMLKTKKKEQIQRIIKTPDLAHSSARAVVRITQILSIAEKIKEDAEISRLENLLSQFSNEELEKIQFGSTLYKEFSLREFQEKGYDAITILKFLEKRHNALKQIEQDLWRMTMIVVSPGGTPRLLNLSELGARNWQEVLYPKMTFPYLKYSYPEIAKDLDSDQKPSELAASIVHTLDCYLSSHARYSLDEKLMVSDQFHQGIFSHVHPRDERMKDLVLRVQAPKTNFFSSKKEKQQDLQERYEAFCLAHWRTGTNLPLYVNPGSDWDIEGLADYANAQEHQDVGFKKTITVTANLQKRRVVGNYLIHFTNPFSKKTETHYYCIQHNYGSKMSEQSSFVVRKEPKDFPDLRTYLFIPKFCP